MERNFQFISSGTFWIVFPRKPSHNADRMSGPTSCVEASCMWFRFQVCLWRVLHVNHFRIPIQLHLCDHIQIRIRSTNSKLLSDKLVCFFAKHHGRQQRHQDWYQLRVRVPIDAQSQKFSFKLHTSRTPFQLICGCRKSFLPWDSYETTFLNTK